MKTGKEVVTDFKESMCTIFDGDLAQWDYVAVPRLNDS